MLLIIAYLIRVDLEATLSVPLAVLNTSITSIPINSGDVYPILLQGLIIAASMLFGFYAILLFYFVRDINDFLNKSLSGDDNQYLRIISKAFALGIVIIPISFLLLSIFSAFHATILYSATLTYTTKQISTNSIPVNALNIWNSNYFWVIKNYSPAGTTAYHYYQSLNADTQGSVRMLFYASWSILSILLLYVLLVFGFFEYLLDKLNKHKVSSLIALSIMALLFYHLKLYLIFYGLVALVIVILILLVYLYRKVQKENKKTL